MSFLKQREISAINERLNYPPNGLFFSDFDGLNLKFVALNRLRDGETTRGFIA